MKSRMADQVAGLLKEGYSFKGAAGMVLDRYGIKTDREGWFRFFGRTLGKRPKKKKKSSQEKSSFGEIAQEVEEKLAKGVSFSSAMQQSLEKRKISPVEYREFYRQVGKILAEKKSRSRREKQKQLEF